MTLGAGDVVAGRYRIVEPLGSGATGVVYRAVQLGLDREVALKVLHRRFALDERARARFEREARVATALDHPSAVGIHDFGDDRDTVFLAMELLRGRTLRRRIADGPALELSELTAIGARIADVLAAAHRLPLVHRDLKPENVFLEPDGAVRVVDFGLAFIAGSERADRMTVEGVVTGTPEYLSPEQARGAAVGPATDVYALGCVLFELIAGRVPFEGSDVEVLTRQLFAPPPRLVEGIAAVPIPAALENLVHLMLAKPPEARPTAAEVRTDLEAIDPSSRGRARDDAHLLGRTARMVSTSARSASGGALDDDAIEVAVFGDVDADLVVALGAAGLVPYSVERAALVAGAAAVYAPAASTELVAELARIGPPVVTDTEASDMARIAALLAAGATEVAVRPVVAADLVRRLRRAIKRAKRR